MTDQTPIFRTRRIKPPVLVLTAAMRVDPFPAMMARRSVRIHNRKAELAARYEAAQMALRAEVLGC